MDQISGFSYSSLPLLLNYLLDMNQVSIKEKRLLTGDIITPGAVSISSI